MNQVTIREQFYTFDLPKQVAVYAEARYSQYYELLSILDKQITKGTKQVFYKMVEDYLVGKYGKNYY